ncbi:hypothetical protein ASC77_04160 [Nocardioides sp. Root1257]|uniref:DUF6318 family protein n=1 Tax=unclassified Nocardioides TaxID=2615069 RepID=UPI0006F729AD|nr:MULTISPECIES: DUF6318 family protein [unclassified Nocardioides]KQW53483.1 hypothetical protein ASC77_04160 [Nocardioides sp. Root1257]KRC56169.1 hypothetical protein ASE24_04160 [Nocardioides sp. Root224]
MIGVVSRTRAVLTAVVLLSALALGGCTDDDPEPKFGPTESTSPASPTSPSTTAAAALSPEDTVRAWVDAQNEALVSGDTTVMEALATSSCQGCSDFSNPIRDVFAEGGSYRGGKWKVDAAKARKSSGSEVTVDVAMTMEAGQTVPRRGADPIPFSADRRIMLFRLASVEPGLRVSFVGFVE